MLAVMLTLILCLGVVAPVAVAADDDGYPKAAAITKLLAVPFGTELPENLEFKFTFTPETWDKDKYDETNMPTFPALMLDLSHQENVITGTPYNSNDITYYVMESEDFITKKEGDWKGAGKYVYTITEEKTTNNLNDDISDYKEYMTYTSMEYKMYIYVLENDSGDYVIDGVGISKSKNDAGEVIPEEKISVITPGGGKDNDNNEYSWSQVIFQNNYWKIAAGDPDDPNTSDAALAVSKKIAGTALAGTITAGDGDYEKYFTFTMKVVPPFIIPKGTNEGMVPDYYHAFVVDSQGVIIDDLSPNADPTIVDGTGAQSHIKISTKSETEFKLKHGQSLFFLNTPIGTVYDITESATPYFQPSYQITTGGNEADPVIGYTSQSIPTGKQHTGEGQGMTANHAAFTNTCESTPETGLNGVPFYGLSLLAAGLFIFFIVYKSRKRKEDGSES